MADGNALHNRPNILGLEKIHGSVINQVLNNPTLWARFQSKAKEFTNKRMDFIVKISNSGRGAWFKGATNLGTAAADTRVQLQYLSTNYAIEAVTIGDEAFQNVNGVVDLHAAELDDVALEMNNSLATAAYAGPTANQMLGLGSIVDDGTVAGTIGGQSRTTYTDLKATVTASGGTLSLAKLATLETAVGDTGSTEKPTLHVVPEDVWNNYESLLQPATVARYADIGYNSLPVRGDSLMQTAELKGAAGFTALTYRGRPVIADKFCTADTWYMLNENYMGLYGRNTVPSSMSQFVSKVNLGQPKTVEAAKFMPSAYHGVFFKKEQMPVNQFAIVGHYIFIGQMIVTQPRRNGKLTGITGV